jgi:hypothetical protein
MAPLANSTTRLVLQLVLAVVIVVLGYVLYQTIMGPAREFQREQAITQESRDRMMQLRRALMAYEREYVGYPRTLDSLEQVIRTDSFFVARRDSIFEVGAGRQLHLDSIGYSARGQRFQYFVVHDDTANVWTYVLRNPATGDSIGTSDPTRVTGLRHAPSWE